MDIDFHYYATYAAARLAGYRADESSVIAYAAQYVDDSSMNHLVDSHGAYYIDEFKPVPTVHTNGELADYEFDIWRWGGSYLDNLRQVWSVFHFIPGNYGATPDKKSYQGPQSWNLWRYGQVDQDEFKMLCLPNSGIATQMINDIREQHRGKNYLLHLIGLRMHVLADTWAHMYYTGSPAWCVNDAGEDVFSRDAAGNERKVGWLRLNYKSWKRDTAEAVGDQVNDLYEHEIATPANPLFTNSAFYLGHGRMGHLPDYPWITYRYKPSWAGDWVVKNNPDSYVKAFRQMAWAMHCIRDNIPFDPLDPNQDKVINVNQERLLRSIFLMQGEEGGRADSQRRCQMWVNKIHGLGLEAPPPYQDMRWLNEYKQSPDKSGTHYVHFNRSARLQFDLVAAALKKDLGVVIDATANCTVLHLRLQSNTGSYIGALEESVTYAGTEYFPRLDRDGATLDFILEEGKTVLQSGDRIRIRTSEPRAGRFCFLGAWATHALYYYTQDYDIDKQSWIVRKVGGSSGPAIVAGDHIVIQNVHYAPQNLVWYEYSNGYRYLTTREGQSAEAVWTMQATAAPQPAVAPVPLKFGGHISLQADNGCYIGGMEKCNYAVFTSQYYPRVADQPIALVLESPTSANNGTQSVRTGDTLRIRTTELATGDYNYLGAWNTPALYYYKKDYDTSKQSWTLEKVRGSAGTEVCVGDVIRIHNQHYGDKPFLTHYQDGGKTWLTTTGDVHTPGIDWVVRKV